MRNPHSPGPSTCPRPLPRPHRRRATACCSTSVPSRAGGGGTREDAGLWASRHEDALPDFDVNLLAENASILDLVVQSSSSVRYLRTSSVVRRQCVPKGLLWVMLDVLTQARIEVEVILWQRLVWMRRGEGGGGSMSVLNFN
jgi:hypothetical protein